MKHYPVKSVRRAARKAERAPVARIEDTAPAGPFVRFRYTRTEVAAGGRGAYVRSATTRFEGGRLSHEALEGELSARAYRDLVEQTRRLFLGQTSLALDWLSMLLPGGTRRRSARD